MVSESAKTRQVRPGMVVECGNNSWWLNQLFQGSLPAPLAGTRNIINVTPTQITAQAPPSKSNSACQGDTAGTAT
jgi:hypothetical protein